jgi:hypothetical protein
MTPRINLATDPHNVRARESMKRTRERRRQALLSMERAAFDVRDAVLRQLGSRLDVLVGPQYDESITALVLRPITEAQWECLRVDLPNGPNAGFRIHRMRRVHLTRPREPEFRGMWWSGVWLHYSGVPWIENANPPTFALILVEQPEAKQKPRTRRYVHEYVQD